MSHPILEALPAVERALAHAEPPFEPLTPFWAETLTRFYESGNRQLVARVGRRGRKSGSVALMATLEGLIGDHKLPPGDLGIVGFVSVNRDEASQRLRTVKAILKALNVGWHPIENGIELDSKPVAYKTFVAREESVVGGTWICGVADEVARWRDGDSATNPATEVLASLRPTMATMPNAKLFLISSPLGNTDAHAAAFDAGEIAGFQSVAFAPSWIANPNMTEEATHLFEADLRIWSREYAAQPQQGVLNAFDAELIDRAFKMPIRPDFIPAEKVMIVDPSLGGSDTWACCIAYWRLPPYGADRDLECPPPRLVIEDIRGVDNATKRGYTSDTLVNSIAMTARKHKVNFIVGDQAEKFSLASAFAERGFQYVAFDWTQSRKEQAVGHVRRLLADGNLWIEPHERMKKELLAFEEKISPKGGLTFSGRGRTHDDYASLILLCGLLDLREDPKKPGMPGSPIGAAEREATRIALAKKMYGVGIWMRGLHGRDIDEVFDEVTGTVMTRQQYKFALQERRVGAAPDEEAKAAVLAGKCVGQDALDWEARCRGVGSGNDNGTGNDALHDAIARLNRKR